MSLEMEYETLFTVIDTWELLRRLPDHELTAGTILFSKLFEVCPPTKVLFGFPIDMDPNDELVTSSKRFQQHAKYMIQMLDRALNMLGPDSELLGDILSDLGKKHARLGVQERFFPFMGEALLATLEQCLGEAFTPEVEKHWKQVYAALSSAMVEAMNSEHAVLTSWAKLKQMDNYDDRAGSLLFQKLFTMCPETKSLFGFPIDMDMTSETMLASRRFKIHSKYFIEMLDKALGMVEAKQMQENMKSLGAMHSEYGVKPEYFPLMGEALFETLKTMLEDDWSPELQTAWADVYGRLSSQMTAAMSVASAGKK